MNREREFRVWIPELSFMDYSPDAIIIWLHRALKRKPLIMDYIGKRDSNGNKIWENDIVKTVPMINENCHRTEIFKIEWSKFYLGTGSGFDFYDYSADNLEVIGNIYENPELLDNLTMIKSDYDEN